MLRPSDLEAGRRELARVTGAGRGLLAFVFVFSMVVNALMLTGPLYMLLVYDRVLGSRSEETLVSLTLLVAFLYGMMGLLDYVRGRVMARIGARTQAALDARVFEAHLRRAARDPARDDTARVRAPLRDVEAIQRLLASPVATALFDVPWTPLFLGAIFLFHPYLGWLATAGGVILVAVTWLNTRLTAGPLTESQIFSARAERTAQGLAAEAELVQSLGMRGNAHHRWQGTRSRALAEGMTLSDRSGLFTVTTKTLRLFLQSAMLGLGAWLVLREQLTPGAMIAGSILLGRALAPIEMLIGQWATVQAARKARGNLVELLATAPPELERTPLPRPAARLVAEGVTVLPPGATQATLRGVSFRLNPGQAMGVIGPSGAGKSTLARTLTGAWRPAAGRIRLDAATLDQYDPDVLGGYMGYLPQSVTLFDGTIAENIARLSPDPDPEAIVEAARKAAAHEMILEFTDGYDTRVGPDGLRLSGGQVQRIGLARALYGDPVLLVLDEPNANLDNEGTAALNAAVRGVKDRDGAVVIIAHRPSAIQECEVALVLKSGAPVMFGPTEEVLAKVLRNADEAIAGARAGAGGVT
ncbi:type I secretion system permease/ATPase [Jannaschia sp. Os4]|uniref:type I secretion system permease/ATPase n=1 Tax=Jannaschia sp. Os4 TaxID=2807617 RepID=UPI00193A1D71|nr:type I secretion system permease/ATPase [Jannaschia sp. Os4]MBM2575820.1 type I secretion system permease/ATPase [Jannaschia sp. Os4]